MTDPTLDAILIIIFTAILFAWVGFILRSYLDAIRARREEKADAEELRRAALAAERNAAAHGEGFEWRD
jgi:flagellar biosynthesis/type III secretory pathway M-ring protein FliF/YscJ